MPQPLNPVIEAILQERFPRKLLVDFADALAQSATGGQVSSEYGHLRAEIETARLELASLPPAQLAALHAAVLARKQASSQAVAAEKKAGQLAREAAKEAARFCNLANARADFLHWAKADYWTLDEAVALLLGRDPGVVNPEAFARESSAAFGLSFFKADKVVEPTGFARTYLRLRALMERADALGGPRLKPLVVIDWARRTQAVDVPEPLARLATQFNPPSVSADAPIAVAFATLEGVEGPAASATRNTGEMPEKWTPEQLLEMAAYRKSNGTKATAAHFSISPQRVRSLLPKEAPASAAHSIFNHRVR